MPSEIHQNELKELKIPCNHCRRLSYCLLSNPTCRACVYRLRLFDHVLPPSRIESLSSSLPVGPLSMGDCNDGSDRRSHCAMPGHGEETYPNTPPSQMLARTNRIRKVTSFRVLWSSYRPLMTKPSTALSRSGVRLGIWLDVRGPLSSILRVATNTLIFSNLCLHCCTTLRLPKLREHPNILSDNESKISVQAPHLGSLISSCVCYRKISRCHVLMCPFECHVGVHGTIPLRA
jgi:hypothetical protein